jgi:hypothetical protein
MEKQVSVALAAKFEEALQRLEEAISLIRDNLDSAERAPFIRAIGEIYSIVNNQIYARLEKANPELHEVLFRDLPKSSPEHLLHISDYSNKFED